MRDINPKTFGRWMRRRPANAAAVSLQEVKTVHTPEHGSNVRVVLPNRVEVVVPIHSTAELACVLQEAAKCSG